ncbi:MAG TPA: CDP-alcohol phosphatidyltransferase family protein [Steroidobacteraceae bacterium]|nr:CDP-alcohol phosphatidyltransferase family protein [Steroidobacteraceae bacterium]
MRRWLRHIPNLITSLRIVLVIPTAIALLHHELITTMVFFCVAAASDLLDGFLAKRFGWQSALGGVLDPAADKLLLATVFVVLAVLHWVPLWLVAAALARDLVIVLGALAYRLRFGPIEAHPTAVSKLNTLCQALFILGVIARREFALPAAWVIVALGALTFVTISVSGIDYVSRYGKAALTRSRAVEAGSSLGGSGSRGSKLT